MLDPVEDDPPLAPPERPASLEEPAHVDDDDYDVYESVLPIGSVRDAWLAIAWTLAFTALVGWALYLYLDSPDEVNAEPAPTATLGVMSTSPGVTPVKPSMIVGEIKPSPRPLLVRVVEPETLGGRAKSTEDKPQPPDYLKMINEGSVVSGVYGELSTRNFVTMSAATSVHLLYPDQEIDVLIGHLQADDPSLTDVTPVPAGNFGGIARCATSKFSELSKVVCVWAADQSVGILTWIDQPDQQARDEFLILREQIEHLVTP